MIVKQNNKFILKSKDDSKVLGTFDTEKEAKDREREIQYFKHRNESLINNIENFLKEAKEEKLLLSDFIIKHQTAKAYLLQKDGKEFWIKKSSVRSDNTLTPSAIQSWKEAETINKRRDNEKAYKDAIKEPVELIRKPDYESDKAIGFDIELYNSAYDSSSKKRIFIPKSQIVDNKIPRWLLEKIMNDYITPDTVFRKGIFWKEQKNITDLFLKTDKGAKLRKYFK